MHHRRATTGAARSRTMALGVALALNVGCGGATDVTGGTGGTGGSGGGGSGGTAASAPGDGGSLRDGPAPPSAQASVSLHVAEAESTTMRCSPGRQWVNAPSTLALVQTQQTSGTDIATRAIDGREGNHVVCAVEKSSDNFNFSADITTPRSDGMNVLHPTVLHFEASAIARNGPPAKGTVTVMNESTGANFADDQCSFSVAPQGAATMLDIDPGKIWASVTCEQLAHPTETDDVCRIDAGFLVFENCTP